MLERIISRKVITEFFKRPLGTTTTSLKEQKVLVKDVNINYIKVGNGPQNLLLLPGALGSIWTHFKPQVEGLNHSKFTVIVWEPPGYGHSRPPERTFSPDYYFRDAEYAAEFMKVVVGQQRHVRNSTDMVVLRRLFWNQDINTDCCLALGISKFSLLGWSDGGVTSLVIAANNTQAVQKLIVWGANAFVSDKDVETYVALRDVSSMSERFRSSMEELYGADEFVEMWHKWVDCRVQIRNGRDGGDICKRMLSSIDCDTLVLHGEKDHLLPKSHATLLVSEIKNSRMHTTENGKHNIHLKFANDFNKLVEEFLLK